jgi:hypothetical protein
MPTDIRLTSDRDLELDGTGDIAVETGEDNLRQQHANAAFRAAESIDSQLSTPETREDLRIAIRRELRDLEYVNSIETLRVEALSPGRLNVVISTDATPDAVTQEVTT